MKRNYFFLMALLVVLSMGSCVSPKKFVYMQDMEVGKGYPFDTNYEAIVHCNDRLDITVSSKSPELAVPFNANGGVFQIGTNGIVSNGTAIEGVKTEKQGYRVDKDGNINFPILGTLHVEGMKVSEVTNMIRNLIISGDYIKDPLVSLEFLNFKYSVLGAVSKTGTYAVEGDRITLLEAIAKAGDLETRARVDRVAVIREEGGERVMYMHDLRSKDLYQSPCYYLQQNDVVYVEPKYLKKDREEKTIQYATLLLSVVTAACSVIWAFKK